MSVIAAAAALVIVLALIEVPISRHYRQWRRRRTSRRGTGRAPYLD